MRLRATSGALGGSRGSILLEVVVAALLVALLVAPLAGAFAGTVGEARSVRQRAGGDAAGDAASPAVEGWEWGPRVIGGWWGPGPLLRMRVSQMVGGASSAVQVGLWVDGWLVAQEAVVRSDRTGTATTNDLEMGPELWTGLAESELVIRVRTPGGIWGPPWRLAVPELGAGTPSSGSACGPSPPEPTVVVHRPGAGTSPLSASWIPTALASPPLGLLFPLAAAIQGWGGATLDERSQWWWMEGGRSVDLYF